MQVRSTVKESVEPQVAGGKARIPYASRLRTLIDSVHVAIALVRAMDLIDIYVIVCVQGHVRPLFACGQRRPPGAGLHAGSSTVTAQDTGPRLTRC